MTEVVVYKVPEVAAILRISKAQVYEMVKSGQLFSIKVGNQIRVPVDALDQLLKPPPK